MLLALAPPTPTQHSSWAPVRVRLLAVLVSIRVVAQQATTSSMDIRAVAKRAAGHVWSPHRGVEDVRTGLLRVRIALQTPAVTNA